MVGTFTTRAAKTTRSGQAADSLLTMSAGGSGPLPHFLPGPPILLPAENNTEVHNEHQGPP